jgi:hypothetical protein
MAGGGMNHEAGGFVQHQQRFVLKQNVERDVFGLRCGGFRFRPFNFHNFAGAWCVGGLGGLAIDGYTPLFDQPLERSP